MCKISVRTVLENVMMAGNGERKINLTLNPSFLSSPSVICINVSPPPPHYYSSPFFWPSSQRPTVFLLDWSCLGKQVTAAVCGCVCAHGCVCVCSYCPFVVVSPHMLALTCWRVRIMSYKPLLKLDFFTLLLARGDNKNSMTRPSLGHRPVVRKAFVNSVSHG